MARFGLIALAVLPLLAPSLASAQGDPMAAALRATHDMIKDNIMKAAEKVPEDQYGFKPAPDVRTFGQLVGHVANANYMICSRAAGEKSPATADVEKTMSSKADLSAALKASFDYCDATYAKMTAEKGAEMVDFFVGGKQPRLAVMAFNNGHNWEHYGNIATYMRIKGMVPPSSEGR
jgi:uncharacterized damage-inducible protein DinB